MDAVILRKRSGAIHFWKKYEVNSVTTYTWNRWNLVSTTIYKWNKWSISNPSHIVWYDNIGKPTISNSRDTWSSYRYDGNRFYGTGNRLTVHVFADDPLIHQNRYSFPEGENPSDTSMDILGSFIEVGGAGSGYMMYTGEQWRSVSTTGPSGVWPTKYVSSNMQVQGGTSYGQVTSTSSSAYPSNGVSGSYWYVSAGSEVQYSKGSTQQADVSSTSATAYPENGHDGSYWYDNRTSNTTHSMGSYIEDIFSTDPSKYPANGISGSFWYVYQGQL